MKFLKFLALLLCVLNSFSQDKEKDSIELTSFFNEKTYNSKKARLFKSILENNSSTTTTEEWILFFKNEETKNKNNFSELFHVIKCQSLLFIHEKAYDKSNEILYRFYYTYKNVANKNDLCNLLNILTKNCIQLNKQSELLIINKEQLEVCPTSASFYELYSKIGLADLAIKNYKKKVSFKKNGTGFKYGKDLNNIGVLYKRDHKYDSAFYYFNKSLIIFREAKQKNLKENKKLLDFWISLVKGNLGKCYLEYKNYDTAIELFIAEEKEAKRWFKDKVWPYEDDYFRDIAKCFLNTGKLDLAKKYIDSLFLKKNIYLYSKLKADYFDATKKYDSANYYNKLFIKIADSIALENKRESNKSILKLIDFQEKLVAQEFEIKEDNKLHQKELIINALILIFLILLIIILCFLIYKKK
ncbi:MULTISPECIES: tetratricopeptide repeat protein [unclassified Polaribacter]|uniref:tetratricopeptide repeat protein n=1 Tax=unclassified Polaribacter TaxID=196858 RepID=UPI0011BE279D|nr:MULTISPECIES: tetratricopeptide repeat protein [unclassified Polaribacter]TXD51538.1 tetratricopeptide repeat protein [Polaribacter sp. IC063]TXD56224.1 tetratricopeptide repeat protein [Polaribacter sp. IC066]